MGNLNFGINEKVYVSSDWHLDHKNISGPHSRWEKGYRNYSSVEEMNEAIITAMQKQVSPDSHLILLGDVSFAPQNRTKELLSRIDCKTKHIVWGNHDKHLRSSHPFDTAHDILRLRVGPHRAVCCHYPLLSWENMHKGVVHLHGHCHNCLQYNTRAQDVGIDGPSQMQLEEFKALAIRIKSTPFTATDYHE